MALSSSDITNKLSEYINYFESNGNYWNGNQTLSRESWGVSDTPCSPSCNPNQFAGGIQCYAFARFIAYLLTGVVVENEDVGGWKKHTSFHNYSIKPGDIVDVDDSNGEHHAIVHRINDNGTIEFLELWSSAVYGCLVAHGQFNGGATWNVSTEAEIKSIATQIMECPPIEEGTPAPVPGSTPTPTTVSVTLHNVNAAGSTMTMTATYGQPYGNVLAPLNVAGYTFKGWYTEPNGGGTKYTFMSNVDRVGNHIFYAHFVEQE